MFLGKEGPLIHWGQSFLKPWNNIHLSYNFECTFPLFPGLLGMVATKDDLFLCLKLEDVDESSVFQWHPLPCLVPTFFPKWSTFLAEIWRPNRWPSERLKQSNVQELEPFDLPKSYRNFCPCKNLTELPNREAGKAKTRLPFLTTIFQGISTRCFFTSGRVNLKITASHPLQ